MPFPPSTSNPGLTEISACRHVVQLAVKMDVPKLTVELACKGLVSILKDHDKNLYAVRPINEEAKGLLSSCRDFRVRWVRRSANGSPHILAKERVCNELYKVRFHVPADCILNVVSS